MLIWPYESVRLKRRGRLRLALLTKLLKWPRRLNQTDSHGQISTLLTLQYDFEAKRNSNPHAQLLSFFSQNWSKKMND